MMDIMYHVVRYVVGTTISMLFRTKRRDDGIRLVAFFDSTPAVQFQRSTMLCECRPAARILQLLAIYAQNKAVRKQPSSAFSCSRNLHCGSMNDQCGFVSPLSSAGGVMPTTKPTKRRDSTSSADSDEANNKTVQYFLLKSEPSEYSISDMERDTQEEWGGIRNFQARNFLRSMNVGDRAFFYHSKSSTTGIVGTVKIARTAQPDASALDPKSEYFDAKSSKENNRWDSVLIEYEQTFPVAITLKELKEEAANNPDGVIASMALFKQSRLSVVPLTFEQWEAVLGLVNRTCDTQETMEEEIQNKNNTSFAV